MAVTKIKKQNTFHDINDARVPAAESADKYLHSKTEGGAVVLEWADAPVELPALPEDAIEKTYVLKAVNGVLSWVEEVAAEVSDAAE